MLLVGCLGSRSSCPPSSAGQTPTQLSHIEFCRAERTISREEVLSEEVRRKGRRRERRDKRQDIQSLQLAVGY